MKYIPFSKIIKEFKKSPFQPTTVFLCHRSKTFDSLWKTNKERIKELAKEFLKESLLLELVNVPEAHTSVLFSRTPFSSANLDKVRIDFLYWGAAKNRDKRRR